MTKLTDAELKAAAIEVANCAVYRRPIGCHDGLAERWLQVYRESLKTFGLDEQREVRT